VLCNDVTLGLVCWCLTALSTQIGYIVPQETHSNINKPKEKLETKASSHEGWCIPAGSSVSLPRRVVNYYVSNNHA